jgi:flagellar hook-associated protein FlgK
LALIEKLNEELNDLGGMVSQEMDGLIAAAKEAKNSSSAEKLSETVVSQAEKLKKRIHELDKRIQSTAVERERLKKKEIELKILERQFRKGLQQD